MIRWLQLFFAIVAFSTVADFYTTIGINITCPKTSSTTQKPNNSSSTATVQQSLIIHPKLQIAYPFEFSQQKVNNTCPGQEYTYTHVPSLKASPQFFVMTGVLSLIYASGSLVIYLCFSSTYDSVPVWPLADLIVTAILCLFWFIASSSFSSGVSLLKSTVVYENFEQALCPAPFKKLMDANCLIGDQPSWKSLDVGLVSGFTSFFLWGAGLWFVYKETHFHAPSETYGLPK